MRDRVLMIIAAVLCLASVSCTAFAMNKPSAIDEFVEPEMSEPVLANYALANTLSEGSETGSESADVPTVNITDESIDKIANAINGIANYQFAYQYLLEFTSQYNTAQYVILDTDEPDLLNDFNLFIHEMKGQTKLYVVIGADVWVSDNKICYSNGNRTTSYAYQSVISFESVASVGRFSGTQSNAVIGYSNYNVYDLNSDALIHKSDFVRDFMITLDTGDSGLTFDPIKYGDNFVLPTPDVDGLIFHGWYIDPDFTTLFSTETVVDRDMTLYAKFEQEPVMGVFHRSLFDALAIWFQCEPMVYMLSIFGLLIIFASGKRLICARL